jgi:hypothetical protein
MQLLAMLLLRLLPFRLEEAEGDSWWFHPPWNKRKTRPSVLDLERLLRQRRTEIQQLLAAELGSWRESGGLGTREGWEHERATGRQLRRQVFPRRAAARAAPADRESLCHVRPICY